MTEGVFIRNDYYGQLRAFHTAAGLRVRDIYDPLDDQSINLRRRLIKEEAQEVKEAFSSDNAAHLVHELLDLLYVIFGTFVEMGINPAHGFRALHEKNMQKIGGPKSKHGKQLRPKGFVRLDVGDIYPELGPETAKDINPRGK